MKSVARIRVIRQTPFPAALLALPLCAACLSLSVRAEDAPADKAKADALAALIAKLDDEDFAVRQNAKKALFAYGQAAPDTVRAAV